MSKAIEKWFVNGRLMMKRVHQWPEGAPLPERRRVEAVFYPGSYRHNFQFPVKCGDIFAPVKGDVLVVRWVRGNQRHYIAKGGYWWCFKNRDAYRQFMAELQESGNYRSDLGPQQVKRT